MELLHGKKLVDKHNNIVTAELVMKTKDLVVFFFGTGRCNHSMEMTKKLRAIHMEGYKRHIKMEIIYVSSDLDVESFKAGFKAHGEWFAVPFGDELGEQLRNFFGITSLPAISVCRKNGEIVTTTGGKEVNELGLNVLVTWVDTELYEDDE